MVTKLVLVQMNWMQADTYKHHASRVQRVDE